MEIILQLAFYAATGATLVVLVATVLASALLGVGIVATAWEG